MSGPTVEWPLGQAVGVVFGAGTALWGAFRRRTYLGTVRARNRFVKLLDEVRSRYAFSLIGYVVMPEHVHLLISEPRKGNPSKVLQVLKQRVSRSLRRKRPSALKQLRRGGCGA